MYVAVCTCLQRAPRRRPALMERRRGMCAVRRSAVRRSAHCPDATRSGMYPSGSRTRWSTHWSLIRGGTVNSWHSNRPRSATPIRPRPRPRPTTSIHRQVEGEGESTRISSTLYLAPYQLHPNVLFDGLSLIRVADHGKHAECSSSAKSMRVARRISSRHLAVGAVGSDHEQRIDLMQLTGLVHVRQCSAQLDAD